MSLELLIAIAALGLSAWSAATAVRLSREQNRMQAHILRFETARERDRIEEGQIAVLRAELSRRAHSATLSVHNDGRSPARNVRILVDGSPLHEHQLFRTDRPEISVIAPGAQADLLMMTYDGMPDRYQVELRWTDDSRRPGKWESELTIAY